MAHLLDRYSMQNIIEPYVVRNKRMPTRFVIGSQSVCGADFGDLLLKALDM